MVSALPRNSLVRHLLAVFLVPLAVWVGFFVLHGVGSTILLTALAAGSAIVIANSRVAKNALLTLLAIILTMGACEAALRIRGPERPLAFHWGTGRVQHSSVQAFAMDPQYGFDAVPNVVTRTTSQLNGRPVYDVTYSFDAKGARVTPGASATGKPILVVGDSYNFGEGLNDSETLGAHLQKDSRGTLRAINIARPGYGPHQVLRQLQLGLPAEHGAASFDWLLVSMIDDHIERANGSYFWSLGPHFVPDGQGGVRLSGHFGPGAKSRAWVTRLREGSMLFTAIEKMGRRLVGTDEQHFVAILRAMRETAMQRYGARPLILYYSGASFLNEFEGRRELMHRLFEQAGVLYLDINTVLPVRDGGYYIEGDGHPTEKLNAALAGIVLRRIGHPEF
jgi:hypothetical protein